MDAAAQQFQGFCYIQSYLPASKNEPATYPFTIHRIPGPISFPYLFLVMDLSANNRRIYMRNIRRFQQLPKIRGMDRNRRRITTYIGCLSYQRVLPPRPADFADICSLSCFPGNKRDEYRVFAAYAMYGSRACYPQKCN